MSITRRQALATFGSVGLAAILDSCSTSSKDRDSATSRPDTTRAAAAPATAPTTTTSSAEPVIRRLDHVFAVVEDAPRALRFAQQALRLPLVWPFTDYGSFASGAISLGNLNLELVAAGSGWTAHHPARITGVAFEPAMAVGDRFVKELDRRGVAHSPPMPGPAWTNISFISTAADDMKVFATDYRYPGAKDPELRRKPLDEARGGRLRVAGASELVLGVRDVDAAQQRWQTLLSPAVPDRAMRWELGTGPAFRLVRHERDEVLDLVLKAGLTDANGVLASLRESDDPLGGLPVSFERP